MHVNSEMKFEPCEVASLTKIERFQGVVLGSSKKILGSSEGMGVLFKGMMSEMIRGMIVMGIAEVIKGKTEMIMGMIVMGTAEVFKGKAEMNRGTIVEMGKAEMF